MLRRTLIEAEELDALEPLRELSRFSHLARRNLDLKPGGLHRLSHTQNPPGGSAPVRETERAYIYDFCQSNSTLELMGF